MAQVKESFCVLETLPYNFNVFAPNERIGSFRSKITQLTIIFFVVAESMPGRVDSSEEPELRRNEPEDHPAGQDP